MSASAIVCATDLSEVSRAAVCHARAAAEWDGSDLHVVLTGLDARTAGRTTPAAADADGFRSAGGDGRERHTCVVRAGHPVDAVVDYAREIGARLIVVAGRAYDSLQGSLRELAVLRETAIPKARQASDAISDGYGQGRFSLLEVLDAQSSLTQARLREQEALQNFHIAVATIEVLVGNPFALARGNAR